MSSRSLQPSVIVASLLAHKIAARFPPRVYVPEARTPRSVTRPFIPHLVAGVRVPEQDHDGGLRASARVRKSRPRTPSDAYDAYFLPCFLASFLPCFLTRVRAVAPGAAIIAVGASPMIRTVVRSAGENARVKNFNRRNILAPRGNVSRDYSNFRIPRACCPSNSDRTRLFLGFEPRSRS